MQDLVSHLEIAGLRPLKTTSKRQVRSATRLLTTTHQTRPRDLTRLDIRRGKRRWLARYYMRWHLFDTIGALYHLRSTPLRLGKRIVLPVLSGTALYRVELRVSKRERVRSKLGVLDCWRLDGQAVRMLSDGRAYPRRKPRAVTFWLSADRRRLPVRIAGRSKIGWIDALISSYRPPRQALALRPLLPAPVTLQTLQTPRKAKPRVQVRPRPPGRRER